MACNRVFQRHFNNYPNYSGILYLNWRIPKFYLYSEEFIFGEGKKSSNHFEIIDTGEWNVTIINTRAKFYPATRLSDKGNRDACDSPLDAKNPRRHR